MSGEEPGSPASARPAARLGTATGATFAELRRAAARAVASVSDSPALDADLLLARAAGIARSTVLAHPERELAAAAAAAFAAAVGRRAEGVPVAYLIGRREFFDFELHVDDAVLVPRPETELLVEAALALLPPRDERPGREDAGPRILDLGTGSGAIALALKRARADLRVVAADASSAALRVARANAARLGLAVEWIESDWYASLSGRRFDAILCNPPYVASGDPHFLGPLRFEPRAALDGGADGLDALRAVLGGARAQLAPGGRLLVEHGAGQRGAVLALAGAADLDLVAAGADLAGRDRFVMLEPRTLGART